MDVRGFGLGPVSNPFAQPPQGGGSPQVSYAELVMRKGLDTGGNAQDAGGSLQDKVAKLGDAQKIQNQLAMLQFHTDTVPTPGFGGGLNVGSPATASERLMRTFQR